VAEKKRDIVCDSDIYVHCTWGTFWEISSPKHIRFARGFVGRIQLVAGAVFQFNSPHKTAGKVGLQREVCT
jgi:hypothetical protein